MRPQEVVGLRIRGGHGSVSCVEVSSSNARPAIWEASKTSNSPCRGLKLLLGRAECFREDIAAYVDQFAAMKLGSE